MSVTEPELHQYVSPAKAADRLASLSDADLLRLKRLAQIRSKVCQGLDWEDLLQEAVVRLLNGQRRWPLSVPFHVFMMQTMRSIAYEEARHGIEGPVIASGQGSDSESTRFLNDFPDPTPSPEREVMARQQIAAIEAKFSNDSRVRAILKGMALGWSPEEIQGQEGMTATEYASAQRRIRRKLAETGL